MFKFFTESIKEFDHVAWPTNKETKKYFSIVVSLIVFLTLFLFILWTIFSSGLFFIKDKYFPSVTNIKNSSNNITPTNLKLGSWSESTSSWTILNLSWSTDNIEILTDSWTEK